MPSKTTFDVDRIASGIGSKTISRRAVAKGAAWSLPVLATGIAAPAVAASSETCSCNVQQQCFIELPAPAGECKCAPGLVCVGTGPLGLANVCVSVGLTTGGGPISCGIASCYGVCASTDGTLISAVNTLASSLSGVVDELLGLLSDPLGILEGSVVSVGGIPSDVCISPLNDGHLGSLCQYVHAGGLFGLLGTVSDVTNILLALFDNLGLLLVSQDGCKNGMVCQPMVGSELDVSALGLPVATADVEIGVCACPGTTVSAGATTHATPISPKEYDALEQKARAQKQSKGTGAGGGADSSGSASPTASSTTSATPQSTSTPSTSGQQPTPSTTPPPQPTSPVEPTGE